MTSSLNTFVERAKKNGALAIFSNLLFDTVMLGWIVFAGLYAVEALLPTFVIARLSLVKFSIILIALTVLLAGLRKSLPQIVSKELHSSFFILAATVFFVGTITIAHYRFPWWSIPMCVGGYTFIVWFLLRNRDTAR